MPARRRLYSNLPLTALCYSAQAPSEELCYLPKASLYPGLEAALGSRRSVTSSLQIHHLTGDQAAQSRMYHFRARKELEQHAQVQLLAAAFASASAVRGLPATLHGKRLGTTGHGLWQPTAGSDYCGQSSSSIAIPFEE